jgi:hypothetical protein
LTEKNGKKTIKRTKINLGDLRREEESKREMADLLNSCIAASSPLFTTKTK